jgi:hypothetical protein
VTTSCRRIRRPYRNCAGYWLWGLRTCIFRMHILRALHPGDNSKYRTHLKKLKLAKKI